MTVLRLCLVILVLVVLQGVWREHHLHTNNYEYEAPEPFPYLHSFDAAGRPPQPLSPDPLVRYVWSPGTNTSQLQVYRVSKPHSIDVVLPHHDHGHANANAVTGIAAFLENGTPLTIIHSTNTSTLAAVQEYTVSIQIDWGVERAAWFEFISHDLDLTHINITASISEHRVPQKGPLPLVKYGQHTYRLETNPELYEGIRFTWLHLNMNVANKNKTSPSNKPAEYTWHIESLSLVAKIKPVTYLGDFAMDTLVSDSANQHTPFSARSSDVLTHIWYTAAYGVRLNLEADQVNTVLIERGDRVSIVGTNHPVLATAMAAFGGSPALYQLVHHELTRTNAGKVHGHPNQVVDHQIVAYPIYWTLSVNEYFRTTGDTKGFLWLAPDVRSLLEPHIYDFLLDMDDNHLDLVWMAWDDRLGDGWCQGHCGREAHLTFGALIVRACHDFGHTLIMAGDLVNGTYFTSTAHRLGAIMRQQVLVPEYPHGLGVHSAAHIINAGHSNNIAQNQQEIDDLFETYLNDSVTICSLSNFDQYWILQGLANANRMEHALASIQLCWGTALPLGAGKGCFWEVYSPEWASFMKDGEKAPIGISYCHPWAAGVGAWLSHTAAGIQPLLPGYERILVMPYVSPRFPMVRATVPTLHGPVSVEAQLTSLTNESKSVVNSVVRMLTMTVQSSKPGLVAIRTVIGSSSGNKDGKGADCTLDVTTVRVNGVPVTPQSLAGISSSSPRRVQMALDGYLVPTVAKVLRFLRIERGGNHTVTASYQGDDCQSQQIQKEEHTARHIAKESATTDGIGIPHFPPFPVPSYPASTFVDRRSGGDGLKTYGSDGYVLFGFNTDGTDLRNLPSYVKNVTVFHHNYYGWTELPRSFVGECSHNSTYLPNPKGGGSKRALGMIGDDYQFLGRGIILDVDIDQEQLQLTNNSSDFSVSVYSVAHQKDETYAFRVQDRRTLNLIAPTFLVANHTKGVWSSIHYNHSLRIRLVAISGAHASALVFGKPVARLDHYETTIL